MIMPIRFDELANLDREALEKRAGVAAWLLANAIVNRGTLEMQTSPVRDELLGDVYEGVEIVADSLAPNKPATLRLIKRKEVPNDGTGRDESRPERASGDTSGLGDSSQSAGS